MRTTDGRNAFAAAENADDRTRASLGAAVLGVTVSPGDNDGAAGSGGAWADPVASLFGEGAWRRQPVAPTAVSNTMTRAVLTEAI
jgi:hypothetical protein